MRRWIHPAAATVGPYLAGLIWQWAGDDAEAFGYADGEELDGSPSGGSPGSWSGSVGPAISPGTHGAGSYAKLRTSGLNGHSYVDFDFGAHGTRCQEVDNGGSSLDNKFPSNGTMTQFWVVTLPTTDVTGTSASADKFIFDSSKSSPTNGGRRYMIYNRNSKTIFSGRFVSNVQSFLQFTDSSILANGNNVLITSIWNGAASKLRVNADDGTEQTGTISNTVESWTTSLKIGHLYSGNPTNKSGYFEGKIHECLWYDSALSGAHLAQTETYLMDKYAL